MRPLTAVLTALALTGFGLPTMAQQTQPPLYGTVVSVDAANGKVVITPKGGSDVTVVTDANTKIHVKDKDATLADVQPGMTVRVSPATGTAADIRAFQPRATPTPAPSPAPASVLYGKVVSVDAAGGKVVIAPKSGPQVTVTTDANTKVRVKDKDATLADVQPDMMLRVSPAMGTAADIRAFLPQVSK